MSVLSLRGVSKRIVDGTKRRTVIDEVALDMERGDIVIIRGPSGSGKTTLLAVAGGMLLPTVGEVVIDGEATSRLRDAHRAEIRRQKVGFVFQDVQLVEGMTTIENILLPAIPDGRDERARAKMLLERFGMTPFAATVARKLSGGERQRVALIRALLLDPILLLLDEPTAHLDAERAAQLASDLATLADEGKALLVATHDPRLILGRSRILELTDGKLREAPPVTSLAMS